jgi:nucleoside-diphosphate-sugar epimerase
MVGISGGAGYIGAQLTKKLIENGEQVWIVDIAEPPGMFRGKVEYCKADINDKESIFQAIKGCDTFYCGCSCLYLPTSRDNVMLFKKEKK